MQETLCKKYKSSQKQSALDFALASTNSFASVSLNGRIHTVINLNNTKKLQRVVDCFKNFKISNKIIKKSKALGLETPTLIKTVPELLHALLTTDWRFWPMFFDVPSTSQIFGQLVQRAEIEGILYPSKFTNQNCLVIFPNNLSKISDSFIQLGDDAPPETSITRLDSSTWPKLQIM